MVEEKTLENKTENLVKAERFFKLGDQYGETANLLLETLINNGNSNAGIGKTAEEAQKNMEKTALKSDLYLFIPAIFNCLQTTELFTKGLLLLNDKTFQKTHSIEKLLEEIAISYGETSEINQALRDFYECQINIIEKYKQTNGLINSHDLYMSLRYPEITIKIKGEEKKEQQVDVDYTDLMCNGNCGIKQFKILQRKLQRVKSAVVNEYHNRY